MQVIDLHLYLKCHSSTGVFQIFASKNQLPVFCISGAFVENGLRSFSDKIPKKLWIKDKESQYIFKFCDS